MNWTEFFHMGGYAFEVWVSWGLTGAVLLWFVISPKLKHRQVIKSVHRQTLRERRISQSEDQL